MRAHNKVKPTGTGAFLKCTQNVQNEKKTEYLPRVLQVEKATFTPAVFCTSGGIGKEADKLIRRMAERMSAKRGETYSSTCSELPEKEIQVRPAKDLYNSTGNVRICQFMHSILRFFGDI